MNRQDIEKLFSTARKNDLELPQALRVRSRRFGDLNSPFSDDGLDFNEVREYEAGDKLRDIDMPSYNQNRELVTVRYEATRELKALVVADLSSSMFVREEKFRMATAVFSRIFFSTLDLYIPTNLWCIGDTWDFSKLANLNVSEYWYEIQDTFIGLALNGEIEEESNGFDADDWAGILPPKSLVFVVSDFLGEQKDKLLEIVDEFSYENYVLPVVVQDDLEYTFPDHKAIPRFGGNVAFSDTDHNGKNLSSAINRETAKATKYANESRFAELAEEFSEMNLSFAHIKSFDWPNINDTLQEVLDDITST